MALTLAGLATLARLRDVGTFASAAHLWVGEVFCWCGKGGVVG